MENEKLFIDEYNSEVIASNLHENQLTIKLAFLLIISGIIIALLMVFLYLFYSLLVEYEEMDLGFLIVFLISLVFIVSISVYFLFQIRNKNIKENQNIAKKMDKARISELNWMEVILHQHEKFKGLRNGNPEETDEQIVKKATLWILLNIKDEIKIVTHDDNGQVLDAF